MNQAVMHGAHETFSLFFRQRNGRYNKDAEVTKPGRLFQLLGCHRDLNTCLREIAGLQVLQGIECRT